MEIFKILGVALIGVFITTILKSVKRDDIAIIVILIASLIIFTFVIIKLESIVNLLNSFIDSALVNKEYLILLLKVTGISYMVELTSNICKDANCASIASKVEIAGKVAIVILTIPILTSIIQVIMNLM